MKTLKLFKYPRTNHLPWSDGLSDDDKKIETLSDFEGKQIVVTEKMDGENTTMYNNYIHSRSLDSANHVSRDWVKSLHAQISHNIPEGWRVCGENLYAVHSIEYDNLPTYFMAFSVWDDNNDCLSWDDTLNWLRLLDLQPVPVLFEGTFEDFMRVESQLRQSLLDSNKEGYVIRVRDKIAREDFPTNYAKYVRANHVQTDEHWMHTQIRKNKLTGNV